MRRTTMMVGFALMMLAGSAGADPARSRVVFEGPFAGVAKAADPVVVARSVVASVLPTAASADLSARSVTREAPGRPRVVRLEQRHQGVLVMYRGAGVGLRADGTPVFAAVRLEEQLPSSVVPRLSAAEAAARAAQRTGLAAEAKDAALAIYPMPSGARLSWVVAPSARLPGVPYAPVVILDANDGSRLAGWNMATSLNQAKVYEFNPVSSPTLIDTTLPVGAGKATLEDDRVVSWNCIDKKSVKAISFQGFNLNVHVCDLLQTATPDANGDFVSYAPAADTAPEDPFSEISMFYHVNKAYDRFASFGMTDLGTKPLPTVSNLMLPQGYQTQDVTKMADPNLAFVPFQNAFFAPANPIFSSIFGLSGAAMWFGQGPNRDYAYDGDVVYHEFTHAVVDHTLQLVGTWHADEQGLIDSPGAMNEGLADYFSSSITGDPACGEYAAKDFAPSLTSIRDLSNTMTCPNNLSGEVHSDSQFFSATLWKVRASLSSDADKLAYDKALFDAMAASPGGDLGYEDLLALFVASVKASPLGATVADALTAEATARGALPSCKRVLEYKGQPLKGADPMVARAFFAPGTDDAAMSGIEYAPGFIQFHAAVTPAATMKVTFTSVNVGGGGGSPFNQGTPFAPKLLVRWGDQPISFTYSPGLATTADVTTDVTLTGNAGEATVDLPAEATQAYVMIVNAGSLEGGYTSVDFAFEGSAPVPEGGAPDAGDAGADASEAPPATGDAPSDDSSGCGCRTAASSPVDTRATLALGAALSLALARRRRRRA